MKRTDARKGPNLHVLLAILRATLVPRNHARAGLRLTRSTFAVATSPTSSSSSGITVDHETLRTCIDTDHEEHLGAEVEIQLDIQLFAHLHLR